MIDCVQRDIYAHVAVLQAFVGPRPVGHFACHNNGNKHDNRQCGGGGDQGYAWIHT